MTHRSTVLALTLAASAALLATVTLPPSAEANSSSLVCCENENGTYHPVSSNGRAADYCVQTWSIPTDEAPGLFCDLGPQCPTDLVGAADYCADLTAAECFNPTCAPDEFFCYLAVDTDGQVTCFAQFHQQ